MTREEYKALRQSYRDAEWRERRDAEWRERKRQQLAKLVAWAIAIILVSGALMVSVWMGGMRYMP